MAQPRKRTRAQNQAAHYERLQREAATQGPDAVATVWQNAARMVARQRSQAGDDSVWEDYAATLRAWYQRHAG
ncbi:hypothetical protein [Streptomyces sp. SM14]|uniref:hypothetical protein n=1 Tax=Streptomyces sp. SM14 TaxID=1736045 RepID=UPI000CD52ED4|nr:hypothetical protein [Streptomyces sp. SM14]